MTAFSKFSSHPLTPLCDPVLKIHSHPRVRARATTLAHHPYNMKAIALCLLVLPNVACQALLKAVKDNNPSMINIAIKSGDKVNAMSADGDSVLMMAVRHGKHKAVKALLNAKADASIKDAAGMSVMQVAAEVGNQRSLLVLLTHGMDPNEKGPDGLRPIHRAVVKGHTDVVKALLNAEVPMDQPTGEGKLPLELTDDLAVKEVLKKFSRVKQDL